MQNGVSEKEIERKLYNEIAAKGGRAFKFITLNFTGLPDRIVLLPGGRVFFVELKAPGKGLRPRQALVADWLRGLGFYVGLVNSWESLENFLHDTDIN